MLALNSPPSCWIFLTIRVTGSATRPDSWDYPLNSFCLAIVCHRMTQTQWCVLPISQRDKSANHVFWVVSRSLSAIAQSTTSQVQKSLVFQTSTCPLSFKPRDHWLAWLLWNKPNCAGGENWPFFQLFPQVSWDHRMCYQVMGWSLRVWFSTQLHSFLCLALQGRKIPSKW